MEDILQLLEQFPCIYQPLRFRKDLCEIRALIDLGSEVNAIIPAYTVKLGFEVHKTDIEAQKIQGFTLGIFGIVLATF